MKVALTSMTLILTWTVETCGRKFARTKIIMNMTIHYEEYKLKICYTFTSCLSLNQLAANQIRRGILGFLPTDELVDEYDDCCLISVLRSCLFVAPS